MQRKNGKWSIQAVVLSDSKNKNNTEYGSVGPMWS